MILASLFTVACMANKTSNNGDMEKNADILKNFSSEGYAFDSFTSPKGRQIDLIFIKHGSIALLVDGFLIYVDPVTIYGNDFSRLPGADLILVTHEHHDHFDVKAIEELQRESDKIIGSKRIGELYSSASVMLPGEKTEIPNQDFSIEAVPAYNITEGHLQFHPKERKDIGFIFDIDGLRIYVAGDTEDIPEMADLKDIDIAFLPVNQPYTMTPQQALNAVKMIKPRILYPYHYGETDLTPLVDALKGSETEVRVRQLQ